MRTCTCYMYICIEHISMCFYIIIVCLFQLKVSKVFVTETIANENKLLFCGLVEKHNIFLTI